MRADWSCAAAPRAAASLAVFKLASAFSLPSPSSAHWRCNAVTRSCSVLA